MDCYIIYKHTCSINGKSYIGQTKQYEKRCDQHSKPYSRCTAFRNAIQKHGWHNFQSLVLADGLTLDEANTLEERFIREHNTVSPYGYNLALGGRNHACHPDTRAKLSARPHVPITEETRQKLIAARRARPPHSEETKRKIGDARRGRPLSEETKSKLRKPKSKYTSNVPIIQFDLAGNEVARFSSPKEATSITGIKYLGNCLAGTSKTAGGYIWKYVESRS